MRLSDLRSAAAAGVLLVLACLAGNVHAGPANPFPQVVRQPDGTSLDVIMRGDEFQGHMETADGYTVVRNAASGYLEFAVVGADRQLAPSGWVASPAMRDLLLSRGAMPPKGLRPPRNTQLEWFRQRQLASFSQLRATRGLQAVGPTGTWAPKPVTGPKKVLVILVNFANAALSPSASTYWNSAVFDVNSWSVAKYWQDNSYGKISVAPVPHTQPGNPPGIVTVSLGQNHPNSGSTFTYSVESAWVNAALAAAAPYVNFPALDADADGTIEPHETAIYFVLAGYETSAGSGLVPSIWAHAWGGPNVSVSGKTVANWALNGEYYNATTLMAMGVIAHETGHSMTGLPDLYDISNTNEGLGIFSLMAGGSWGFRPGEVQGSTPVGLDAWSRQFLGWSTPQRPTNGATATLVSGLASASSAFMLMDESVSSSEYWLVENRPPVGWDEGMSPFLGSWTGGVLIQHLDLNIGTPSTNSFNKYVAGSHQGNVAVEPSTATCSMLSTSTPSRGCRTLLFYTGNSNAFTSASTPPSSYYSGTASTFGVSSISAPGATMTATFSTLPTSYLLSVTRQGSGSGTVGSSPAGIDCGTACSASFGAGSSVTLTATPAAGSQFAGWSGACSGTGSCVVAMTAAKSVSASFTPLTTGGPKVSLVVTKVGAGRGGVGSAPGGISCGGTCTAKFAAGARVTLSAVAAAGSRFTGWSGACSGTGNCVVTMNVARSVSASFASGPLGAR